MLPHALQLLKKQKKTGQRKRQYQLGRQKIIEIELLDDGKEIITLTASNKGAGAWVLCNATGNGNGYARYQIYIWDGSLGIGRKIMDFNGNDAVVQGWIDAHPISSSWHEIFPYFFSGDWLHLFVSQEPEQLQTELICGYYNFNDLLPGGGNAPYTGWNIAYRHQPDMEPRQFVPPPGDFINSWWRIPRLEVAAGPAGDHRDAAFLYNTNAFSTGTVPYLESDRLITQGIGRKIADPSTYIGTSKQRYAERWTDTDSFANPSPPAAFPRYDASPATEGWWLSDRGSPADFGGVPSYCWGNTADEFYHYWAYRNASGSITNTSFFRYNKGADTYTKMTLKVPIFPASSWGYSDRMLESNTFIGYARSHGVVDVSAETGGPGSYIDFYVGTTWGTESILFSFNAATDIPKEHYIYTATNAANMDPGISFDDEFSRYYQAIYFTCLKTTAGKREFLFITGNYNLDKWGHEYILGYPPAAVVWKEETNKFELLYVHPYPKGTLSVDGDHVPVLKGSHAEDVQGDYGLLLQVIAYDYNGDATPNSVLWKFLNINVKTAEQVDLLKVPFKKPAHLGGGVELINQSDAYNPICVENLNLQFAP